jgi:predicted transcriptional regulator
MGAIKPNHYTDQELSISLIADAISHPFRTRIVKLLQEQKTIRNVDLANYFSLSATTIKTHLDKLKNAGLIYYEYEVHYYLIKLNTSNFSELRKFILQEENNC